MHVNIVSLLTYLNQHPVFLQAGCPSSCPINSIRTPMGKCFQPLPRGTSALLTKLMKGTAIKLSQPFNWSGSYTSLIGFNLWRLQVPKGDELPNLHYLQIIFLFCCYMHTPRGGASGPSCFRMESTGLCRTADDSVIIFCVVCCSCACRRRIPFVCSSLASPSSTLSCLLLSR